MALGLNMEYGNLKNMSEWTAKILRRSEMGTVRGERMKILVFTQRPVREASATVRRAV